MATAELFELFFDLPSELREQILGYLLIKPGFIQITQGHEPMGMGAARQSLSSSGNGDGEDEDEDRDEDWDEAYDPRWPLNYFLVSQTFNREATATYFRENTFQISFKGAKVLWSRLQHHSRPAHQHSTQRPMPPLSFYKHPRSGDAAGAGAALPLFQNPTWTPSVRRIRNVVVHIQRLRGSVQQSVFEPLLDMILAGGLKQLELRLGWDTSRGKGVFRALPMRCMYRVLADPDLLVARLRIPARNHESIWCAFHEDGGDNGYGGCAMSKGGLGGPRSGWLDVNVAALIHAYGEMDDHLRIFKVGE